MSNKGFKSERLEMQPLWKLDPKIFKNKTQAERKAAIREAHRNFVDRGSIGVRGVKLIYRWRNPDNRNPAHANWKYTTDPGQSLHDFWKTLGKGRGALR